LKNGYTIKKTNYRSRFGEIDIIASYKNFIVFIEVKTRHDNSMISPMEYVDKHKRSRIIKTALLYLGHTRINLQSRFDVIEVVISSLNSNEFSINHIKNAFLLDETWAKRGFSY
jgi:putative endonuclease